MLQVWGRVVGKLLGREGSESTLVNSQLNVSQQCAQAAKKIQWHPVLYQTKCNQQDYGGDFCPVLSSGEAAPSVLCSILGSLLQ